MRREGIERCVEGGAWSGRTTAWVPDSLRLRYGFRDDGGLRFSIDKDE